MLSCLQVPVADSAQKNWALFGSGPGQKDQLIGGNPLGAVDFMAFYHFAGDVEPSCG